MLLVIALQRPDGRIDFVCPDCYTTLNKNEPHCDGCRPETA